jgi:hypothetical protein
LNPIRSQPLERIARRVTLRGDVNDPATPRPLLTLAEFFEGNDVVGSIGCNLVPTPAPQEFHEALNRIAARPDVIDVRVQVAMFDDPAWPFSDTVWIITSAQPDEVIEWFDAAIRPDRCDSGWPDYAIEPCPVPAGMQAVQCWWD